MPSTSGIDSVRLLLRPLEEYLTSNSVNEICINRPGELYIESDGCWLRRVVPRLSFLWAQSLAVAVARSSSWSPWRSSPFLSATLPDGQRLQLVMPPVSDHGTIVMSIRNRLAGLPALEQYRRRDLTSSADGRDSERRDPESDVMTWIRSDEFVELLRGFVRDRKNIAIVGKTGTGKTTLANVLCQMIDSEERILALEDAHELRIEQANHVHLYFGVDIGVGVSDTLRAALRLRPDRLILAELRGAEAFDFLQMLMSGHSGSITTFHAESADSALEQFSLLARMHQSAHAYTPQQLMRLAARCIDLVVHIDRLESGRVIKSVCFPRDCQFV